MLVSAPGCPQARYCCSGCQQEGERWRRWRGNRQYQRSARRQRLAVGGKSTSPGTCQRQFLRRAGLQRIQPEVHIERASVVVESAAATSADVASSAALLVRGAKRSEFLGVGAARSVQLDLGAIACFVPKRCAPGAAFLLPGVPSTGRFTACAGSRSTLVAAAATALVEVAAGPSAATVRCICLLRVESWQG